MNRSMTNPGGPMGPMPNSGGPMGSMGPAPMGQNPMSQKPMGQNPMGPMPPVTTQQQGMSQSYDAPNKSDFSKMMNKFGTFVKTVSQEDADFYGESKMQFLNLLHSLLYLQNMYIYIY